MVEGEDGSKGGGDISGFNANLCALEISKEASVFEVGEEGGVYEEDTLR
jgi:hypothetical protein